MSFIIYSEINDARCYANVLPKKKGGWVVSFIIYSEISDARCYANVIQRGAIDKKYFSFRCSETYDVMASS